MAIKRAPHASSRGDNFAPAFVQCHDRPVVDLPGIAPASVDRRNEIAQARWEHVDLKASRLFVPLSKSAKPRYVFLNSTLRARSLQARACITTLVLAVYKASARWQSRPL